MSFAKDMAKLAGICYDNLQKSKVIRDYLAFRKISNATIDQFFLGAFPTDIRILLKEFKSDFLIKTGILYNASQSRFRLYPLIIPIWDANNNFIGIGGRSMMPEKQRNALGYPKYKNSNYDKANHLFGLNYAKNHIRDKNTAIVVEGYFDVISSHQAGLSNVVATSGAFLSAKQVMLLSRYSENINVLFDNDEAGIKASEKFIDRMCEPGVIIKKICLPNRFKDIDEHLSNIDSVKEALNYYNQK